MNVAAAFVGAIAGSVFAGWAADFAGASVFAEAAACVGSTPFGASAPVRSFIGALTGVAVGLRDGPLSRNVSISTTAPTATPALVSTRRRERPCGGLVSCEAGVSVSVGRAGGGSGGGVSTRQGDAGVGAT